MVKTAYIKFGKWGGPYQTVAADDYRESLAPRSGMTQSGYGARIPTHHMVKYAGRWRRVYCICYSNSGSLYIRIDGAKIIVDIHD